MKITHGHCTHTSFSRTYASWQSMIQRCTNKKLRSFKWYGARGITICDRWMKFQNFLADMGERPENTSLDRINNDGNYEQQNCRWATSQTQTNNQRRRTKDAKPRIDLTGKSFGRWTAIRFDVRPTLKTHWVCLCKCGTERPVRTEALVQGRSTSCGCSFKEKESAVLTNWQNSDEALKAMGVT